MLQGDERGAASLCAFSRRQNKAGAEWGRGRFGASRRAPGVGKDRLQVGRARVRHITVECDESWGLSGSGTSPLLPRIESRITTYTGSLHPIAWDAAHTQQQ